MYSVRDYLKFAQNIFEQRGISGVYNEGKSYAYETILRQLAPFFNKEETYVLDEDWDMLIILDACRVDVLEDVADEYAFLPDPPFDSVWSAASFSEGWLTANFTGKQAVRHRNKMKSMAHITGNPFTESVFSENPFGTLDEVWKYGWSDAKGLLPPDVVTDQAIRTHRETDPNSMLVHYMQPHAPFITDTDAFDYEIDIDAFADPDVEVSKRTPWELLRDGEVSHDEVWDGYKDTLRAVLDSVEILLESVDADRVVISADHASAIGEWGVYGHPRGVAVPALRTVPWVVTSANDSGSYEPANRETNVDADREEQLRKLGYL